LTPASQSQHLIAKYQGLSGRNPEAAAAIVGRVEKNNYLAHTIREIELAILIKKGIHCHIATLMSESYRHTGIRFSKSGCEIRIRYPDPDLEHDAFLPNLGVRLVLAHELGHLTYNFDEIKEILERGDPSSDYTYDRDEEVYAWRFARSLVLEKSKEYEDGFRLAEFVYDRSTIDRFLMWRLRGRIPDEDLGKILAP
jgi:hypothetical protein